MPIFGPPYMIELPIYPDTIINSGEFRGHISFVNEIQTAVSQPVPRAILSWVSIVRVFKHVLKSTRGTSVILTA